MGFCQEEKGRDRADEGQQHIGLGIPDISLGAKKGFGAGAAEHRDPPFDQFVKGAECKAEAADEKISPSGGSDHPFSNHNFPRDDGRDKALSKVADLVVIVALQLEAVSNPVKQRNLGVRVMATDHQDDAVKQNQKVAQRGQRKLFAAQRQDNDTDQRRQYFQKPGRIIFRRNG